MSAAAANPVPMPAPQRRRKRGQAVVVHQIDWETYTRLLEAFGDRPRPRLTYDRGDLEIMVPSYEHETDAEMLAALVVILTKAFRLPLRRGGSTTL